jgi:hypothetical protein
MVAIALLCLVRNSFSVTPATRATMTEIQAPQVGQRAADATDCELYRPLQNVQNYSNSSDHAEEEYHREYVNIGQQIAHQH